MGENGSTAEPGLVPHKTTRRSHLLLQTFVLPGPPLPLTPLTRPHTRDPLKLSSIVAVTPPSILAPRHLPTPPSVMQGSLFTTGERAVLEGFSRSRRRPLHRPPPRDPGALPLPAHSAPTLPKKGDMRGQSQPVYTHFSCPIRPAAKIPRSRPRSMGPPAVSQELRPLVLQYRCCALAESLSVRGTPCLPRLPPPQPRTQLHVFLPAGGQKEEEEEEEEEKKEGGQVGDTESVDEGFMEELDSKVTALSLHQREPMSCTDTHNSTDTDHTLQS